jgi:Mn-dependent DtxR family transcriptional regulator
MLDIDYQILKIIYRTNGNARLKYIQDEIETIQEIKIPLSTINSCIERLEKKKYVDWIRYSPLKLTERGTDLAKELIRHAQLLELLLYKELELSTEEAHIESEKFNLLFSCRTINKICEKYSHPKRCPCGEIISSASDCYCEKES